MSRASKIHCLIRIAPSAFLEDFCCNGRLYMNTLKFFKDSEDKLRGDKSEGLSESHPAKDCQLSIQVNSEWLPINGLTEQFRFGDPHNINTNIFSLYAITEKNEDQFVDYNVHGFGDSAGVIVQGDEFLHRVKEAIEKRGWTYNYDLVDYVDKHKYSGQMGPFRKYSDLEFQSEFRIATVANRGGPLDDFCVGDLRDITVRTDTKTLCDRFKIQNGRLFFAT